LAWALAAAHDAPRLIVSALANDELDIAAIVLARSRRRTPRLRDDRM
jgi:uncharacterized protein (DUF2336 family)